MMFSMDVCTTKSSTSISSMSMGWGSSTSIISLTILSFMCFRISSSNCSFFFTFSLSSSFLQQQFHWDLHDAYFIVSYCEQLQIVCPKSIPRYKYLSASGVRVFANAVRFGLTCMSKIDGVCTVPVTSCPSFCFLCSKVCHPTGCLTIRFRGEVTDHLLCHYWSPIVWFFGLDLRWCICNTLPE